MTHACWTAWRWIGGISMSEQQDNQALPERVTRIVDFRIPLPYLLTGVAIVVWALIGQYFAMQQLQRDVQELQITVKAGNTQGMATAGEMALLKYRIENLENDRVRPPQPNQPNRR